MTTVTRSRRFTSAVAYTWLPIRVFRATSVAALSGALAGLLTLGFGLRLAMKLSAMAAGQDGAVTEAQATVGDFTPEGTMFLLIAGTSAGASGGLIFAATSAELRRLGRLRGLVFGLVLLAIAGAGVIDDANPDFRRFGPPALNVALFAILFVAFGLAIAPVHGWLDRALRPTNSRPGAIGLLAVLTVGAFFSLISLFGPAIMLSSGDNSGGSRPLVVLLLVLATMVSWPAISWLRAHLRVSMRSRGALAAVLLAPVLGGSSLLAISVGRIVSG